MWKRKVEAGVLLYALFMAAIFSLLLQFYLNRQVANQRNFVYNQERTTAYALAVLSRGDGKGEQGREEFKEGSVQRQKQDKDWQMTVRLKSGRDYLFYFPAEEEKKEEQPRDKEDQERSEQ